MNVVTMTEHAEKIECIPNVILLNEHALLVINKNAELIEN